MSDVELREVAETDLARFFEFQLDAEASRMAAFTAKDPTDRAAFEAHWERILADPTVRVRTIVQAGEIVGHVASWEEDGRPEVTYWIGKEYWGRGFATSALRLFLANVNRARPIHARAAADNAGSIRVLEKCGFVQIGSETAFANARGEEVTELVYVRME